MTDLSRIPTEDLLAFKAGNLTAVSTPSLLTLRDLNTQSSEKFGPRDDEQSYSLGHYAGITGRAISNGLQAPAELLQSLPVMGVNAALGTNYKTAFQQDQEIMDRAGFPSPATAGQRVYSDTISGVTNPLNIMSGPLGFAAGATSGLASGVTRESGGGPLAQFGAGIVGGLTPAAVTTGIPSIVRGTMRGGSQSAAAMKNTIQDFEQVGTTPTVGQASKNPMMRWLESTLSKTPGGMNPLMNKAEKQAEEMGVGVDAMAAKLSPKSSGEQAGRAIQGGIKNTFIPEARKSQKKLYDALDKYIPQGTGVDATNFVQTANKLTAPIPGAKAVSETKLLSNAGVNELKIAAAKDMGGSPSTTSSILDEFGIPYKTPGVPGTNKLPYEAVKEIRTRIGEKLSQLDLAPDVSKAELKQLYGALTKDMESAAKSAGPEAYAAFKRANNYTKALHDRIDILQGVIDKNGGPEKIFQAATSGTAEGATTFRAVTRSLPQDGKKMVTATIMRRLGRATPGNQNELGDVFSANTFLTNWNKLSPEAKEVMSGPFGKQFRTDLDTVARVADNLKKGSKVYANPSGTAQAATNTATLGAFIYSLFSGNLVAAGAIAGAAGGANLSSRALTNPRFVRWLAHNSRRPISALPGSLDALTDSAREANDTDTLDVIDELKNKGGQ